MSSNTRFYEIITKKEDFTSENRLEKNRQFYLFGIEWRSLNNLDLNKEKSKKMIEVLSALEDLDDVQNIFTNANLDS